jgi:hypothetical protein
MEAYGWPDGQSQTGNREILTYPQGTITLDGGRVTRIDFSPNIPWRAPKPPPPAASATKPKPETKDPLILRDFWVTDFDAAARAASVRQARLLVLFTGSDWSPLSKTFYDDVAMNADFIGAMMGDFVLVLLDYPTHTAQPPALKQQNARLRESCGVTTYPSLLVLNPSGDVVARVDLSKLQPGSNYRDQVIAAVNDVRELLKSQPPPTPAPAPVEPSPAPAVPAEPPPAPPSWFRENAAPLLIIAAILLLSAWGWWLRKRLVPAGKKPALKIDVPTLAGMAHWSREQVREIVAGLAEANGHRVELKEAASGADLALRRTDDEKTRVLVRCLPGSAGPVPPRPVSDFFATITLEGVEVGWFVSPGGFTSEAREHARQRGLILVNGEELAEQLRALPPLALTRVLARGR